MYSCRVVQSHDCWQILVEILVVGWPIDVSSVVNPEAGTSLFSSVAKVQLTFAAMPRSITGSCNGSSSGNDDKPRLFFSKESGTGKISW